MAKVQAKRVVKSLIKKGLIKKESRINIDNKGYTSNLYTLLNPKPENKNNNDKKGMVSVRYHESGTTYVTVYAHLSQFKVDVGEKSLKAPYIGLMGNTGYSTGPHLHYEVRVNGVPMNPRYFIP